MLPIMSRIRGQLPHDDDPDATDELPALEIDADDLEDTGSWSQEELAPVQAGGEAVRNFGQPAGDVARDGQAAESAGELARALRDKSLTIEQLQRDLGKARDEISRLGQVSTRTVSELEHRLQEVERDRLKLAAQHDERRTTLAALEDQLSEVREVQQRLERELARARDEVAAAEAARGQAVARAEELVAELARGSRAAMGDVHEREQQRLQELIHELRNSLAVARDELDQMAQERDLLKAGAEQRVDEFIRLKDELAEKSLRIESLLERLRSAEALRRFGADFRAGRKAPDVQRAAALAARVDELEHALEAERDAGPRAEAAATQSVADWTAATEADEPTIAGEDRESLLSRLSELGAEISRRDDRIATLEADLRSQSRAIDSIRHGLGLLPEGSAEPKAGAAAPRRYLARIDEGNAVVHVLSQPRVAIGRTSDNDLQIRETYISRHHAVILLGEEAVTVEDAGSSNGVYVNGRRVRRAALEDGDILALGKAHYRFHVRAPEPGTD